MRFFYLKRFLKKIIEIENKFNINIPPNRRTLYAVFVHGFRNSPDVRKFKFETHSTDGERSTLILTVRNVKHRISLKHKPFGLIQITQRFSGVYRRKK